MKNTKIIKHYIREYIVQETACGILYLFFIGCSLAGPLLMEYFIDTVIPQKEVKSIIIFAVIFLCVYLLMAVLAIFIKRTIVGIENNIITDIRNRMYENLVYQSLRFYQEHSLGASMQRIVGDSEVVHSLWGFLFPSAFSSIITFVVVFAIMLSKSILIALLSLFSIAIYLGVFRYYNEKLRTLFLKTRKDTDAINSGVTDAWSGAKEIKIFQFESSIVGKFLGLLHVLKKDNSKMAIQNEFSKQFMSLATTIGTLITLALGGWMVVQGQLTLGAMLALQAYVLKLYSPAEDIADMAVDFKKYTVNLDRISELLFLEKEYESSHAESKKIVPEVSFQDVSFSYGTNIVLDHITFSTKNRGVVALVGQSGAGKTTIINLIMGFLAPDEGTVYVAQNQSGALPLQDIRRNITLVSQDAYLFNTSIYENVKIGNPCASPEEIEMIIEKLGINQIVQSHPDGIHAVVSEFGKNLSGGQIQRVSIARALLKKAPIIIFDEATSNIDSQSEKIIQSIIDELKLTSLIILISHRLSSLKSADNILLLDHGKIIEQGSLTEMINLNGTFYTLFHDQLSENYL